jgi:hypothetical protein
LIKDRDLRGKLQSNPQAVLQDPAFKSFPAALQAKFQDPKFRTNFSQFTGHLDSLLNDASRLPIIGDGLVNHVADQISNWDDVTLSGAMDLVSRNPESAADVLTGRKSAIEELGPGGSG